MTKLEAALDILFADNIDDIEGRFSRDDYADVLGVRLLGTSHWSELRSAARSVLLDVLGKVPNV